MMDSGRDDLPDKRTFFLWPMGKFTPMTAPCTPVQGARVAVKLFELYQAAQKATSGSPAPAPVASLTNAQQLDLAAMAAIKVALAAS